VAAFLLNAIMQKRKLGVKGPELSVIGFGAWAIGGPWRWGWGAADKNESIRAIQCAHDLGVNWIDTAPVYGLGESERIVGQAIKGRRENVFIATKCGLRWKENGDVYNDISPQSIRKEVEHSLKRLDTDIIDLYQIHWPSANQSEVRALQEMQRLKKEGKIRWIGVSNFDVSLLKKSIKAGGLDSVQPPFNLFQRDIELGLLPFCEENGLGVLAYSPMFSGLLSGRFDKSNLAADDWRAKHVMFTEPQLSNNLNFVEKLRLIADSLDATVGQLAVAWVLRQSAITSAIVGARSVEQVRENVKAADCIIAEQYIDEIEKICVDFARAK
jgi:aryl-alcohol dehydrogenase-like predicted oxidoreductase